MHATILKGIDDIDHNLFQYAASMRNQIHHENLFIDLIQLIHQPFVRPRLHVGKRKLFAPFSKTTLRALKYRIRKRNAESVKEDSTRSIRKNIN